MEQSMFGRVSLRVFVLAGPWPHIPVLHTNNVLRQSITAQSAWLASAATRSYFQKGFSTARITMPNRKNTGTSLKNL